MRLKAHRIVHARRFEYFLVILIIATAVLRGLATSGDLFDRLEVLMGLVWFLTLAVLVLEALLKMFSTSPRVDRYFRDPWNVFDFLLIGLAFYQPGLAVLIVTVRLLRLLGGFSAVREMNLILSTLVRSLPSMVHIVILLGIIVYMYAIVGHSLFHEHDPARWGTLGVSILSLFQVVTLDDWTAILDTATELEPMAWIYFVSFVVVATFVGINLFVAVVVKKWTKSMRSVCADRGNPSPASPSKANSAPPKTSSARLKANSALPNSPYNAWKSNCSAYFAGMPVKKILTIFRDCPGSTASATR